MRRNEISHYPEIQKFIEEQFRSNLCKADKSISVYWGIGELKQTLSRIISDYPEMCACAKEFADRVPPLNLDIFGLITDGNKFDLLILEIKYLESTGLKEWSQLVGYMLVSGAKYGLLVNIDNGASSRLSYILSTDPSISHITTRYRESFFEHYLGFMRWNSVTQNFEYSSFGTLRTISDLTDKIIENFYSLNSL